MADFDLGRHEALIETLVKGQEEMAKDIGTIKNYLAERKGERKVVLWLAGVAGSFAATIVAFLMRHFNL